MGTIEPEEKIFVAQEEGYDALAVIQREYSI